MTASKNARFLKAFLPALLVLSTLSACTFHTDSKIETVSTINAHIVLDIRQIKDDANDVEGQVRGSADTATPATGNAPAAWAWQAHPAVREAVASGERYAIRFSAAAFTPEPSPATATATPTPSATPRVRSEAETKAIAARKARFEKIEPLLKDGTLGENEHGYVTVLLKPAADNKDKIKAAQSLADDENKDRKTIHAAIAQHAAGDASNAAKLAAVEAVFAERIRDGLKPGYMFQAPSDADGFQAFQKSPLGPLYPGAKPGDWLQAKSHS